MYKFLLLATAGTVCCYGGNVVARTTFLPDWQMADLEFQRDEPLCLDAIDKSGNKLYHKASGCPAPKIFDEYCAHDDRYISECYCPYQPCCYPYPDETGCSCGSYSCSDGCGGIYKTCRLYQPFLGAAVRNFLIFGDKLNLGYLNFLKGCMFFGKLRK